MPRKISRLLVLCCLLVMPLLAVDREAFTFTNYDLDARIEPKQQRLGVRGHITVRDDSNASQKILVLQISSSLNWRSISADNKPLQFVTQPYRSDVDHTGTLSEAVATLPREVKPHEAIQVEIGYEGTISQDATRLTQIGTPESKAKSSDWDQIGRSFSGVRGVGYVAWYPVAMESASLSKDGEVPEVVARWKSRQASASMKVSLQLEESSSDSLPVVICHGATLAKNSTAPTGNSTECNYTPLGIEAPTFVIAPYDSLASNATELFFLPDHKEQDRKYGAASDQVLARVVDWVGEPRSKARLVELADPGAAPFEAGDLMLMPLANPELKFARLTLVHGLTHAAFWSPRPWVNEGIAHFTQALEREQSDGRKAALDYMGLPRAEFLT